MYVCMYVCVYECVRVRVCLSEMSYHIFSSLRDTTRHTQERRIQEDTQHNSSSTVICIIEDSVEKYRSKDSGSESEKI